MKFITTLASSSAACVAALFAFPVHAQQSATPPTAAAPVVPAMQCEKPADTPLLNPSSAHIKRFQKQIDDYKVCVNEYARSMGARANDHAESSRAYAAAANGAIDDYNAYVNALNAKAKGDAGGAGQPAADTKPK